jgi:hypothetical protein
MGSASSVQSFVSELLSCSRIRSAADRNGERPGLERVPHLSSLAVTDGQTSGDTEAAGEGYPSANFGGGDNGVRQFPPVSSAGAVDRPPTAVASSPRDETVLGNSAAFGKSFVDQQRQDGHLHRLMRAAADGETGSGSVQTDRNVCRRITGDCTDDGRCINSQMNSDATYDYSVSAAEFESSK